MGRFQTVGNQPFEGAGTTNHPWRQFSRNRIPSWKVANFTKFAEGWHLSNAFFLICVSDAHEKRGGITLPLSSETWSGRRVSNSRPQPWQGCALPTELLPHSSCEGFELYTVFRDWQELSSKKAEKYHKHGIQRFIFQAFSGDSRRKSAFSSSVLRSPTQPSPVATVRSASSRLRSSMSLMRSSKVPAQRKR